MILVADSGSSSSDWMLNLPDSKPLFFKTKGLNPFFVSEKEIGLDPAAMDSSFPILDLNL